MAVVTKFRVSRVITRMDVNGQPESTDIELFTVYGDDNPENKEFFKYTPSGSITVNTVNPKAAEYFNYGDEMYVTFTKVKE